jgi:hypothetical protein
VKQDDPVNSTDTENATTTAFRFLIVAHPPFVLTLRDNDPLGFVEKKKDTDTYRDTYVRRISFD